MVCAPLLRRLWAVFSVVLAVSMTLALPAGGDLGVAAKNKKKNKAKTITRVFNNGAEISIDIFGPADPFPSTIQVGGFRKGKIKDVDVVLSGLQHTVPDDLDVLLVAPGGKSAFIMSDVGTDNEINGVTLTLDDEAAAPLPDAGTLVSGTFRPTNGGPDFNGDNPFDDFPPPAPSPGDTQLSAFDGTNPNGQWQLFVHDDFAPFNGSFREGWTLEITARDKKK